MDASALGDISRLDDFAIARRTAAYPIQQVLVARVFPGAEGRPPRAIVTVLTHGGAGLAASSAARGTPLPAVSARVDASRTDAEAELERRLVWFRTGSLVDARTGEVQSNDALAYRGQSPHVLSEVELFHAIERADLADAYQLRSVSRVLLGLGGAAAVVTGVIFGIAAITNPCIGMAQGTSTACPVHDGTTEAVLAFGFGLIGVTAMVVAQTFDAMPVDDGTLHELVDADDRSLRDRLLPTKPAHAPEAKVNIVPVAFPGGAGVMVRSTL